MTPDFRTQDIADPSLADRLRSYVTTYAPPMAATLLDIAKGIDRLAFALDEIADDAREQAQIADALYCQRVRGRFRVIHGGRS